MQGITLLTFVMLSLTGLLALPLCMDNSEAGDCKVKGTFVEVNCAEKLKFKHATASCYMNEKDEFIILAINNRKLSKRSLVTDEKTMFEPQVGKVLVRRIKRSVTNEDDFKAEVLGTKELKDLINKPLDINTENPLVTNEVVAAAGSDTTKTTTTHGDDDADKDAIKGVIVIIAHAVGGDNEVSDGQESALTETEEEDLAETLFGLLLLGAILEEVKKHQVEKDE